MSINHAVKQLGVALVAVVTVAFVTTPGQAAFLSKPPLRTVTASASVGGTATIAITNVALLNIAGGAATTLAWTGTTSGGGWKLSDQYIQLTANINTGNGGIQIYTDNTTSTPAFTGIIDGNHPTPAGLVDNTDTAAKLPTAWMASTTTFATGNAALAPIDPNAASGTSFSWFYHADAKQIGGVGNGAATFAPGNSYSTVYAAPSTLLTGETIPVVGGGVHYAQGVNAGVQQFGPFTSGTSVTNIYTEANFATSLVGRTYNTTKLILEAYSL